MSALQSILALLPQTQCTRCGYPDCESYAMAIDDGVAPINQCPPGGEAGIQKLAQLLGQAAIPLNPENGIEGPRSVVWIDEAWCIGCTLCIDACPVDAIIGTHKRMHTVLEQDCTGCELCLPVCPVDCIELENVSGAATGWEAWSATQAENARLRYAARQYRLLVAAPKVPVEAVAQQKFSRVEAALIRARQRAEQNKND